MSKKKGNIYELKAVDFLKNNGFEIIERNFYAKKMGEIDIIAKKNNIFHFIEVKSGQNFDAIYNITPQKLNKLKKSIDYYLQKNNLDVYFSLDAIIFKNEKIEFLQNLTF